MSETNPLSSSESSLLWNFLYYVGPLLLVLTYLIRRRYQYWSMKGVPTPTPIFPLGTLFHRVRQCPKKLELGWAKKYGKMYGEFAGLQPTLTITDAELIQKVLIKDFNHFVNRREIPDLHHIWPKNMFFVQNKDWKRLRSIASPAFTTGKLRKMYGLLHRAVDEMMVVLDKEYSVSKEIDIKTITIGYTMAAIASTMFNINPGTNGDPKKFNEFRFHGMNILSTPHRFVLSLIAPKWLLKLLGINHPLEPKSFDFMISACRKILQNETNQQCLVSIMKNASLSESELKNMNYSQLTANDNEEFAAEKVSNANDKFLSDDEIVAQLSAFFFAGFESTASTISNTIFELAHNQDVQSKVQQEIDECFAAHEDKDLTEKYEAINKLPYFNAMVKESMRKNPVVVRTERSLNSDNYELDGVKLEKGTIVEIPIQAVHMNDSYWPEPQEFRPERFLAENKDKLVTCAYLPFGDGSRNCVGMRFAMLEVRVALAHLIQKYSFHLAKQTPKEFTYKLGTPLLQAEQYPILFERRT